MAENEITIKISGDELKPILEKIMEELLSKMSKSSPLDNIVLPIDSDSTELDYGQAYADCESAEANALNEPDPPKDW